MVKVKQKQNSKRQPDRYLNLAIEKTEHMLQALRYAQLKHQTNVQGISTKDAVIIAHGDMLNADVHIKKYFKKVKLTEEVNGIEKEFKAKAEEREAQAG
jgi:hypothetical protein